MPAPDEDPPLFPLPASAIPDKSHPPEGRGISPLVYELFVLGELVVQPMYGYLLREIADRMLGPYQPLSWGILYPLIRRLESEGLIVSITEKAHPIFPKIERGQPRRVYSITAAGQTRFMNLLVNPTEYGRDTPKLFLIKLTKFQFLEGVQQIAVLQWYEGYVQSLVQTYEGARGYILHNPQILDTERQWILQSINFRLAGCQGELTWLERQIASIPH